MQKVNPKILFIITQSEMGGAQRYLLNTALWLAQRGYQITVAAGEGDGSLNEKLKAKSEKLLASNSYAEGTAGRQIKTKNLKHLKRMPCPITAWLSVREIKKLLQEEQPDVLFLCSTMAGILGSMAGKKYRKQKPLKIVYRIGGWAFRDPRPLWQKKLILFLEKKTAKYKDKIIVNSQLDFDVGLKYKIADREKLVKIYNGIEPQGINFLPKEEAREALVSNVKCQVPNECQISNVKIIGTVANLYKTKGLEYLIEACHILRSTFHVMRFKFIVIGEGPERKNLENLIAKYKLQDGAFLLGRLSEAQKYLKAFDVFVLPSLKEGFPWVLLEAMSAGIPIVATKVGAVPEILENEKSGFLVEPAGAGELANKIKELLENPQLTNRFVSRARERLPRFSQEKMLSQTEQAILS